MIRNKSVALVLAFGSICAIPACAESGSNGGGTGGEDSGSGSSSATGGVNSGTGGSATGGNVGTGGGSTGGASNTGGAATGGMGGDVTGGSGGLVQIPDCTENTECEDNDSCTTNECKQGSCVYPDNGQCECDAAADCEDLDPCTTNTCVEQKCVSANNTEPCATDNNDCTADVCSDGVCGHSSLDGTECSDGDLCTSDICVAGSCEGTDAGLCTTTEVSIRAMRYGATDAWLSLGAANSLSWVGSMTLENAERFAKEDLGDGTFKLRSVATDQYVTFNGDPLLVTADLASAAVLRTVDCGFDGVGIETINDPIAGKFWQAADGGHMFTNNGSCNPENAAAWERFQIVAHEPVDMGGAASLP